MSAIDVFRSALTAEFEGKCDDLAAVRMAKEMTGKDFDVPVFPRETIPMEVRLLYGWHIAYWPAEGAVPLWFLQYRQIVSAKKLAETLEDFQLVETPSDSPFWRG